MKRLPAESHLGLRYGTLVVLGVRRPTRGHSKLLVQCDCGRRYEALPGNVRRAKSCGCLRGRHGYARRGHQASEYTTWRSMRRRCESPSDRHWSSYGGRGIRVGDRWQSFDAFIEDMGSKPSPKHTLERIDNDGHYEPGNCRWATMAEQNRNSRRTKRLTYGGRTLSATAWAAKMGMSRVTLYGRLRKGWPVDDALTAPSQQGIRPHRRRRRDHP